MRATVATVLLCMGGIVLANSPSVPGSDPAAAPTGNFVASLMQAIKHDFDRDVVRGHFDVGSAPDLHRYYCLIDPMTGKHETNGVAGQTVLRPDGMTGLKAGAAVSFYSCLTAEQQGILDTTGYRSSSADTAERPPATVSGASSLPEKVDVAGVRLGMTPDQVRAVLKSKRLLDYLEAAQTIGAAGAVQTATGARFLNIIVAWSTAPATESFEVMFTPVPGKERAMAIVHSGIYSSDTRVLESTEKNALMKKYGGYSTPGELSESPTWRIQSGGAVLVGDACKRRGIFGGLREFKLGTQQPRNLALETSIEEFRFQIESCGVAIVTEDHAIDNGDAPGESRLIGRFTVSAYSPSIALEGAATASQLLEKVAADTPKASTAAGDPLPNL